MLGFLSPGQFKVETFKNTRTHFGGRGAQKRTTIQTRESNRGEASVLSSALGPPANRGGRGMRVCDRVRLSRGPFQARPSGFRDCDQVGWGGRGPAWRRDGQRKGSGCALTPGLEGRVGSLRPFGSGPDDPGGGGVAVQRGRSPRQLRASSEVRRASSRSAQSCLIQAPAVPSAGAQTPSPWGRRRQSRLPGSRIADPGISKKPAMDLGDRASSSPPPQLPAPAPLPPEVAGGRSFRSARWWRGRRAGIPGGLGRGPAAR